MLSVCLSIAGLCWAEWHATGRQETCHTESKCRQESWQCESIL